MTLSVHFRARRLTELDRGRRHPLGTRIVRWAGAGTQPVTYLPMLVRAAVQPCSRAAVQPCSRAGGRAGAARLREVRVRAELRLDDMLRLCTGASVGESPGSGQRERCAVGSEPAELGHDQRILRAVVTPTRLDGPPR